jgi:hypothetical protein
MKYEIYVRLMLLAPILALRAARDNDTSKLLEFLQCRP